MSVASAPPEPAAPAAIPARTRHGRGHTQRGGRLAVLDGLRFLAAMLVVSYHYMGMPNGWGHFTKKIFPTISIPASYGWLGVELFFLISGFVICMSAWGRSLGDFFVSRVVRLYPAYWLAVLATTGVLAGWSRWDKPLPWRDVLTNLTMLQAPLGVGSVDGVYWTLWNEMMFYLLFAIVVWKGVTYRRAVLFCAIWTIASILVSGADNPILSNLIDPQYSSFFIGGIAFYLMYRFGQNPLLWGIVAVSFLIGQDQVYATFHHSEQLIGRTLPNWPVFGLVAFFYLLIAAVALGWFSAIRWSWLTVAGAVTYPLYLLHEEIGWTVFRHYGHEVNPLGLVLGTAAVMVLIAWLVHRMVERPASRALRKVLLRAADQIRTA
ncbi:acyltransferase family protein [Kitasatospora sp. NPDC052896]|uniref:acyltransferase family protein n=1 Tax=Kitasatospora sp. NPDC052896 TaxID=3364061 RepID=UPI0037C78876